MSLIAFDDTAARLREHFLEVIVDVRNEIGTDVVVVQSAAIADVLAWLRDEAGFNMLVDLSGVDWLGRTPRFHVNYHLLSLADDRRMRVKVELDSDEPRLPSVVEVFPTANWQEREAWDMLGISFDGHPDLTRILMPDDWIGHPLRKDYPIGGVPVEYRIEPAYVSAASMVTESGRGAMGGIPARLRGHGGRKSLWTWSGPPATGVRNPEPPPAPTPEQPT